MKKLENNFYIIQDNFFVLPVYHADTGHLHLEARYNYEDLKPKLEEAYKLINLKVLRVFFVDLRVTIT